MKQKLMCVILAISAVAMLTGCTPGGGLDLSQTEANPNRFVWGSLSDIDVSLGDVGLFYPSGSTLRYYDMEAKQEYILCSRPNCRHMSDDCPAYFQKNLAGDSADYVAQIGEYIYLTYNSATPDNWAETEVEKSIMLIRVNPNDGTRTILASWPTQLSAAQTQADFYAYSIRNVGYCGGWAWFCLGMTQQSSMERKGLQYDQITGVELATGKQVILNGGDGWEYSIVSQCMEHLYYRRLRDTEHQLTMDEFYELADEAGVVTIEGITMTEYHEYQTWFWQKKPREYELLSYSMETGEEKVLFSGLTIKEQGYGGGPYTVLGEYNGKALVEERVPDAEGGYSNSFHRRYFLLNPETGETEVLFESENAAALDIAQGHSANCVFPDGKFFHARNITEETAEIWRYDLSTGEELFLFTDDRLITFRIYGPYNSGYFGKHKDHQYQEGFYWISEEDFYAGNLDAMIHYDVG